MARYQLIGLRFGRLVVKALGDKNPRHSYWVCSCDCGTQKVVRGDHLRSGASKSCGCLNKELLSVSKYTHGMSNTSTYRIWANMKARCCNPKNTAWGNYGGRGIGVSNEWSDFAVFLKDMGLRPRGLELDRIDNSLGYSKGNCRWVTRTANANNTRKTVILSLDGEKHPLTVWSQKTGIGGKLITQRINRDGWSIEKALNI